MCQMCLDQKIAGGNGLTREASSKGIYRDFIYSRVAAKFLL